MLAVLTARQVHDALDWKTLDTALTAAFAVGAVVPTRHSHGLGQSDTLLLMPAWNDDAIGVKVVTVIQGASARGASTVGATYVLLDRATGVPRALLDGDALTVRRTAAVSAIAARYMAREDAHRLLMVGTGHLAPWMIRGHYALRPALGQILIWGRDGSRAQQLAQSLSDEGLPVRATTDLAGASHASDIVCCATTAHEPVVRGEWLRPGTHLDLVGGFTPTMREVDDDAVRMSRIAVDSYGGALTEAGDLTDPLARAIITREDIVAELGQLIRGDVAGRVDPQHITMFKSVGTALADLAAASACRQAS